MSVLLAGIIVKIASFTFKSVLVGMINSMVTLIIRQIEIVNEFPRQGEMISMTRKTDLCIFRGTRWNQQNKAITKGFWGKVGVSRGKKLIVKSPGNYVPGSLVGHFITSAQHPSWRWKREWKQKTWLGSGVGSYCQISNSINSLVREQVCSSIS